MTRVKREINLLKKEKAVALLRGYLKKRVTEIQKKLSEKETWLGVLNKVQGLLRDVGEKEESQGSEKGDVSLDGLDLLGCFQHQLSPVKPPAPDSPDPLTLQAMKEAHQESLVEVTSVFRESMSLGSLARPTTGTHTTNNTQLLEIVCLPVVARKGTQNCLLTHHCLKPLPNPLNSQPINSGRTTH